MLFTANQLKASALDEATALLENASYLSDDEARYYPEMVPVRENARLQKYVVRLEDLVEYSMANGISDGGVALQQICEASDIDLGNVIFSVDEVNVLEDVNMEDTVRGCIQAGAQVYYAPVAEADMANIMASTITDLMVLGAQSGQSQITDPFLEAFVDDNFDAIFSEAEVANKIVDKASRKNGSVAASSKDAAVNKISHAVDESASNNRHWTAKKISALRTSISECDMNAQRDPSSARAFNETSAKINQAVEYLSRALRSA